MRIEDYKSYQVLQFKDFLETDFINKRVALKITDINNVDQLIVKLIDVYGDIDVFADGNNVKVVDIKACNEVIVPPVALTDAKRFDFSDLVQILRILIAPNGCEWDRAQTHESIRINMIEEAYELVDAIDSKDLDNIKEECGDVLMQAAFHAQLAVKFDEFDFIDMLTGLCRKLIDRHTHIFGENHASNPEEALKFWNEAKKKEKKYTSTADAMNRIPKNLPSLLYAEKIQKLAKKSGFDWKSVDGALEKVTEETSELISADDAHKFEEAGDLLFAVVNVLRFYHIDPEMALREASNKFYNRYSKVEQLAIERGINMKESELELLDSLWNEVKEKE